jgi:integrase
LSEPTSTTVRGQRRDSARQRQQRHTRRCPRNPNGRGWAPHKCRGPWAWHLNLGVDPVTKRRRQATGSGYRTKDEAQKALDAQRQDLAVTRGRAQSVTLAEWFEQWLDILRTAGRSPTTLARYEGNLRLHIAPLPGYVPLPDVTPEHIDHLLAIVSEPDYVAPTRSGKRWDNEHGLSSASVNRIYDAIRAALAVATKRRLIAWNPASVVEPPAEQNAPQRAWTPQEAAAFLDHAAVRQHRLHAAWHCVLVTGVRRAELAGAWWHAVDLDAARWNLTEARVQVGGKITRKPPKSKAGTRRIYLDAGTVAVLRAHRRAQAAERLAAGPRWNETPHTKDDGESCSCGGPVFTTRLGAPIPPSTLTATRTSLVRRTGLPRVVLHGGRHTSVTVATQHAGITEQASIERDGHAHVATNRRYQHVSEALHRQAAEAIASEIARHRETSSARPPTAGQQ